MQLVFIHGSGGSRAMWHYQTRKFPGADVLDLPGHGHGELLPTVEAYTVWLRSYLEDHAYDDVVLVGHSLGAAVAMQYALDSPSALAALVLIGAGARLRVHPKSIDLLRNAIDEPKQLAPILRYSWKQVDRDLRNELISRHEELGAAAFVNDFEACDRFDVIDRIGDISVPTLALCGEEDKQTPPKYSSFLAEKIAGAQLEVIEGGTHFVFLEKPDAVNLAIETFVRTL